MPDLFPLFHHPHHSLRNQDSSFDNLIILRHVQRIQIARISRMSYSPPYQYIDGTELAEIIKSEKKPGLDYVVVDVRDHDFLGGNIVGCLRAPSAQFQENLDDLVEKTNKIPKVIFHCALSQERGPKAARMYAERCVTSDDAERMVPEVLVLRGGFTQFQAAFKDDPKLVEKWRKEVWRTGYY